MDEPESQNPERSSSGKKAWDWPQEMKLFSPEPPSPKPDPAGTNDVVSNRAGAASSLFWGFREGFLKEVAPEFSVVVVTSYSGEGWKGSPQ